MNQKTLHKTFGLAALTLGLAACQAPKQSLSLEHQGDTLTYVRIAAPVTKYILLPIQESANEARVRLDRGQADDVDMDIRLAVDSIDYYVPFALPTEAAEATLAVRGLKAKARTWDSLRVSNEFDTTNRDEFRPLYHHTPAFAWMNDANGLVYKDGEYHLYFQYNPYGAMWGNMHWGHSVSRDLVHWEHLDPAIARDTLGHIFSGSCIVDKQNDAGFGENAIIAFYTSASDAHGQIQCMAYSRDNGRTFTKYEGNPILTPFDGLRDFRDPKVFRYEPDHKWVMVVSADKEMRFYSSTNLKDWTYMSAFGNGYGALPSQFECPDFVELPVDGDANHKKWALIVNINPGCMFGGSATQYFTGDFDGTRFTCDTAPNVVKWLDYGKDHYATVCYSNTGDRVIAVPWMSNWQYANVTPTHQFRSANSLPRELTMYTQGGQVYLAANAVKEAEVMRGTARTADDLKVDGQEIVDDVLTDCGMAYEVNVDVTPGAARIAGIELCNADGESVKLYFDMQEKRFVMDRTESGIVEFGELGTSITHEKENDEHRKALAVDFKNEFALGTWAPLSLCEGGTYKLQIYVDRSSVEAFIDGGRIAMTNLVFPRKAYDTLRLYTEGGTAQYANLTVYPLSL